MRFVNLHGLVEVRVKAATLVCVVAARTPRQNEKFILALWYSCPRNGVCQGLSRVRYHEWEEVPVRVWSVRLWCKSALDLRRCRQRAIHEEIENLQNQKMVYFYLENYSTMKFLLYAQCSIIVRPMNNLHWVQYQMGVSKMEMHNFHWAQKQLDVSKWNIKNAPQPIFLYEYHKESAHQFLYQIRALNSEENCTN